MRSALVTGAASGIGAACAAELATRGFGVVCADVDESGAHDVARTLEAAVGFRLDVTSEPDTEKAIRAAEERFGPLGCVVTSAGIHRQGEITSMPGSDFDLVMAVNVLGTFLAARCGARAMIRSGHGGSIVLIGSMNSVAISMPGQVAYAASKGAVLALGRTLAAEWAAEGIRVNTVLPGVTDTPLSKPTLTDTDARARSLANVPMQRPAAPEDIAAAVGFLSSNAASYVTGTAFPVDGGQLALRSDYPWFH